MGCLRCGRETDEKQVFCNSCLDDMARHPVSPDATVYIPTRKPGESQKKHPHKKKKSPAPEELVVILKKRMKRLWIMVAVLFCLLAASVVGIYFAWNHTPLNIGQNYQTVDSTAASTADFTGG